MAAQGCTAQRVRGDTDGALARVPTWVDLSNATSPMSVHGRTWRVPAELLRGRPDLPGTPQQTSTISGLHWMR